MKKMVFGLLITLAAVSHSQTIDFENIKFFDTKKPVKCAETKSLLMGLEKIYGEKVFRVAPNDLAIDGKPTLIALLENPKTRTWTLVEYDANYACVLGSGEYSQT